MPVAPTAEPPRRGWLHPTIVRAAALALAAGYAQFAVTTVLGEVAVAFGEASGPDTLSVDAGLSTTTLGLGLAVIRLAGLGALVVAAFADRSGRRRVLLGVTAVGLGLTALAGASPTFWFLVVAAALARPLLSGANTLVAVVAAEETSTAERSKALALVQASYALGSGTVAVLHGYTSLGFRWLFALGVVPLALLPWLGRGMEESPLFVGLSPSQRAGVPGAVDRELWGRLAIVAVLAAAAAVVTGPALTYLFVYGENVLSASPATMAILVLAAGPVGLLGLLSGRWAADVVGRRWAAGAAMVLIALSAVLAYSGTFPALTAGYLVNIAAGGAFGPAAGALLAEVFPTETRATANGWVVAVGVLGAVAGLASFGSLADALGSFAAAGAALWLPTIPVAGLYALLPETRDRELDDEQDRDAQVSSTG